MIARKTAPVLAALLLCQASIALPGYVDIDEEVQLLHVRSDAVGQKRGDAVGQKRGDAVGQKRGDAVGQKRGDAVEQQRSDAVEQQRSDAVINWLNGAGSVAPEFQPHVAPLLRWLHQQWRSHSWEPCLPSSPWFHHIYREYNKIADSLATVGLLTCCSAVYLYQPCQPPYKHVRVHFDGGLREKTSGAGVVLEVGNGDKNGRVTWCDVWRASYFIDSDGNSNSLAAELFAAEEAIAAAYSFCTFGTTATDANGRVAIPGDHRHHIPFDGLVPQPRKPNVRNLYFVDSS